MSSAPFQTVPPDNRPAPGAASANFVEDRKFVDTSQSHHAGTAVDRYRMIGRMLRMLEGQIDGEIRTDDVSRILYSTDASLYQIMPLAVAIPASARDVQRIVEAAAACNLPVLPRGGASSLAGQTVGEAVVIDLTSNLNRIIEINPDEGWAHVEAGVVLDDLNRAAGEFGLMVGPDPASSNRATLGGMVANNSTGTHSILYGNVIRHIRSADVILADGAAVSLGAVSRAEWVEEISSGSRLGALYASLDRLVSDNATVISRDTPGHWRRNSGYRLESLLDENDRNVARVLCGSEGTLAVVTSLKINLVPRPRHTGLGVVHFKTRSQALRAVTAVLGTGPSAVELFDGVALTQFRLAAGLGAMIDFVRGDPGGLLLTEYYGDTREEIEAKLKELNQVVAKLPYGYAVVERTTDKDIATVWAVRKEALGLIMGVRGRKKPLAFIEDAAVPVEHLADYIERLDDFIAKTDTPVAYYAHASGGCLHVRPFIDPKRADELEKLRSISLESMRLVRSFGGSVSSEHGDGLVRSWLNREILGPQLYELNRKLKGIFDPANILNPGKIVDSPDILQHHRYGPDYHTAAMETEMDFSVNDGFDAAIELCSGVGSCRKVGSGTMCPSFMVTMDEEHTTRGRANALRAAMSGRIGVDAFTSRRMYDVMDLCIQCKACKTECPSNVDMAKIKTEWLSQYWKANGLPLRTRLFGMMPELSRRVAGPLAAVVNRLNRSSVGKSMLQRVLGVSSERTLPDFARHPFNVKTNQPFDFAAPVGGERVVVLFVDTFSRYHEPEIAEAAYELLTRVGYEVVIPGEAVCCGRTRLSKGMIDAARRTLESTVSVLAPYARAGYPIIGLEPSCVSALSDDLTSVMHASEDANNIASATISIERFVAEDALGLFSRADWKEECGSVLLHGHCHQKALEGTEPVVRMLRVAGAAVDVVDSGCCGMAGSFGYEKEHVAISRKMAERKLAPAVRSADAATKIAASGTSCRAQIDDLTGRKALHPVQILLQALR